MEKSRKAERPGSSQLQVLRLVSECLCLEKLLSAFVLQSPLFKSQITKKEHLIGQAQATWPSPNQGQGSCFKIAHSTREGNSLKGIWLLKKRGMDAGQTTNCRYPLHSQKQEFPELQLCPGIYKGVTQGLLYLLYLQYKRSWKTALDWVIIMCYLYH